MPDFVYAWLFVIVTIAIIFFVLWGLSELATQIRDHYRKRIYLLAANIAMKHPALLANVWKELDLPVPMPALLELEATTGEIVIPEDPFPLPDSIHTAKRPDLERHVADVEAENLDLRLLLVEANHRAEFCAAEALRKDRTRGMYLRRLRRVDAVTHPGDPQFAVLHPALARRMAMAA